MIRSRLFLAAWSLPLFLSGSVVHAQQTPPPQPPPIPDPQGPQPPTPQPNPRNPQTPRRPGQGVPQAGGGAGFPQGFPGGAGAAQATRPRPYDQVITSAAKSDTGLFTTHRVDDRYYFEIPTSQLGKELLWVTTFRETQTGYGYAGTEVQNRVVRWEKRDDKILLRSVDYQVRANPEGSLKRAVALSSVEPIILTFDIRAYKGDKPTGNPVVDVTTLFTSDPAEFSARRALNAARLDPTRTFIDRVKALPKNIEMDVLATYVAAPALPGLGFPGRAPRNDGPRRDTSTDAITVVLHHSIVGLPEKPMRPREFDDRVGFFATGFYEFGSPENRVQEVQYIKRWRLEKKDPTAALSEPVQPIVYYIGPEVPAKWRPYIKQGIEDWQSAFETAGFKNAIIAKDAPTAQEDPSFDPDDIRYSVIRWLPSTTENAYGPSIADPRTGEILNANIKLYHNVLKLAETWYFTQASPNDPAAQKLPLSDEKLGQLIRYVLSHEVGHTLGLRHNMKASSAFTVAQLRDPKFTAQWGDEASIMDYGRFNYVAQPGDGARLIPKQGPYDYFALEWGYKPVDTSTPAAEKAELNKIASRQIAQPELRFGGGQETVEGRDDPHQKSEDLGSDPIAATTLGLKNLDRVMTYLVPAVQKPGEDYSRLAEVYQDVLGQRSTELDHVAALVGGIVQTNDHYAQGGAAVFAPVPAAKQREAVQFIINNSFMKPASVLTPPFDSRIDGAGVADRVLTEQVRLLARMTTDSRLKNLADTAAQSKPGVAVYAPADLMDDLRKGVWTELTPVTGNVKIDAYRRNLQRTYLTALGSKLGDGTPGPVRPIARGSLMDIKVDIKNALPRVTDRETRLHLMDCNQVIQNLLYPKG